MGILSAFRFAFQNLFFSPVLYGIIASLAVFSSVFETGDRLKDQLTDSYRSQDDTFDFIIVGGGSSGAVLANRLSQFHTVLLLETGGESHPFQAIPGLSLFIPKNPGTDFRHKSVTQSKSCLSCPQKKYILSQGKNLGGTGNLNYMVHLRGNPLDYDNWATITGDPTWSYKGVLRYFIQSEHFVGETSDSHAHGRGGPLQIQIPDWCGLANEFISSGIEMGYPHIDLNGEHSEGFDTVYYPIKRGVRQATYRSYIQPVRNRLSLLIRKFAHVNKVLIREGTNEAHGVEYDRHGHRKIAYANKEVILSAGTLQTPKLLILSGVGQLEHLNALRIPVKSVLPVGKNLQDHFSTLLGPFYINKARTISLDRDIDKQSFVNFALNGKGPLTSTGFTATALVASSYAKAEGLAGWPDIQLTLFALTPHRMFYSDIGHAFGIKENVLHKYYGDVNGKENAFFIMVTLARPHSKGDYCLNSKNPYKPPVISPNYLMDPNDQDVKVMIEGIHRALFIAENTTAFHSLETIYSQTCFPGCEGLPFRSDVYWECYIRHFSVANNDHVGTCPMGKIGSPYAVVDPHLNVQGIKNLRVVDSSVMPTIVGAPTQAATIMIAEKASHLILEKWSHDSKVFYGPPGSKPDPAVQQYGPPPHSPPINNGIGHYGPPPPPPPGSNLNPNYGSPGLKPPLISGGDGFENYDSFSVIRDQLNPNSVGIPGGPTPTPLIPLNPNPQLWSTPQPFPAVTVTPIPPYVGGISPSLPPPLLTPEPSTVLLPPEESFGTPGPTFGTPYVSSTPNYPVSFALDTSRSEKSLVSSQTEASNSTASRQGKSFGVGSSTISSLQEGNQLGQGFDDESIYASTPTSSSYFPSPTPFVTTTQDSPINDATETDVISEGPGFKVVRKRIKTTPRVVVHPRGHLGHQTIQRKAIEPLNETLENLFLTTSSIRPVPKEFVKIRARRPVALRRRKTTTAPVTHYATEDDITAYDTNPVEFSTTSIPIYETTEVPSELKSLGRKRFVRRMYARPLNFNGKKRVTNVKRHTEPLTQPTTVAPITVTSGSPVEVTHNPQGDEQSLEERLDLDAVATEISLEHAAPTTTQSSKVNDDINDDDYYDENISENFETAEIDNENIDKYNVFNTTDPSTSTSQPVVVFKDIELENVEDLSRQARWTNKSNYFHYNLVAEESRNPIMAIDLNPMPEIVAPKDVIEHDMKDGLYETIAVEKNHSSEEGTNADEEANDGVDYEYGDNTTQIPVTEATEIPITFEEANVPDSKSSEVYSDDLIESQSAEYYNNFKDSDSENILESPTTEKNLTSANFTKISDSDKHYNSSYNSLKENESSHLNQTVTSVSITSSISKGRVVNANSAEAASKNTTTTIETVSPTTVSPRYMFRAKNKLMRSHS